MHPLHLLPVTLAAFGVGFWLGKRRVFRRAPGSDPALLLPWDDLEANRLESALLRLAALPSTRWNGAEAWKCKVAVLRRMGASAMAGQAAEAGLQAAPSFGLWLERHALAVEDRDLVRAEQALAAAGRYLDRAETVSADRQEWLLRKAEFAFFDQGDAPQALEALDRMGPVGDAEVGRLRVQVLLALGRFGEAQEVLSPLRQQFPLEAEFRFFEAECQGGLGAWDRVQELLGTLPVELQQRPEYWHLHGLAAAHLGEKAKARDHFERALDLAPSHPDYALDAAHAWMDLGDFTQAERQARRALRLAPKSEGAFLLLAECRQGLQDPEGARRMLRECLLRHPESMEAQHFLAELEAQ